MFRSDPKKTDSLSKSKCDGFAVVLMNICDVAVGKAAPAEGSIKRISLNGIGLIT